MKTGFFDSKNALQNVLNVHFIEVYAECIACLNGVYKNFN